MPCCNGCCNEKRDNGCCPSINWAMGGASRYKTLANKMCGWIEMIAIIRKQIQSDWDSNLTYPSCITIDLVCELITQLDKNQYDIYIGCGCHHSCAAKADSFGLTLEINCRLQNFMIKRCSSCAIDRPTLGNLTDPTFPLYSDRKCINDHLEFLCCIADHFRDLQNVLERYATRASFC